MSKSNTIILVVFLVLILLGVLIYGFVSMGVAAGTKTPGTPSTDEIPQADIDKLATNFKDSFGWMITGADRCNTITQANSLSSEDLKRFVDSYVAKFGITPKNTMDAAYAWCPWNSNDDKLYSKL